MKKSIPIFLTIFFSSLVSAGPAEGAEQFLRGLTEVIRIIFQFLFDTILEINQVDELLFAKLIFFVLIFLVIYVTINENDFFAKKDSTINKIITAAISILTVRFMPDELIQVMFLQYGALGATIGMLIPFIIILFFLHQSNFGPLPRKIGWFIYGVSYIAIFSYSYTDITGIADYVYWTGIVGIVVAFFMDRQIHAAFGSAELRGANRAFEVKRLSRFRKELKETSEALDDTTITSIERKSLEKQISFIKKQISKIHKSL
jgi:hypothetical protein